MARTRPMAALTRVLAAPGFVLMLWALQLLFGRMFGRAAAVSAAAAMRGATWVDDGHRLRGLAEMIAEEPSTLAVLGVTLGASAILAAAFSVVAAPAILTRLSGERSWAEAAAASLRHLPAMLVQTIYGLILRGLGGALAAIPLALMGAWGLPLALLFVGFPVLVLDRARVAVVLDGERPYHPMTFLRSIAAVARRPIWWLGGSLLDALKVGVGIAALLWVISAGSGAGAIWLARLAGLVGLLFGLWRVALAVDSREGAHTS